MRSVKKVSELLVLAVLAFAFTGSVRADVIRGAASKALGDFDGSRDRSMAPSYRMSPVFSAPAANAPARSFSYEPQPAPQPCPGTAAVAKRPAEGNRVFSYEPSQPTYGRSMTPSMRHQPDMFRADRKIRGGY